MFCASFLLILKWELLLIAETWTDQRAGCICEQLLSKVKDRRSSISSKLSDKRLESPVRIATTSPEPHINA